LDLRSLREADLEEYMARKPKITHVIIFQNHPGEWRWSARSRTGDIVSESDEGYNNRFYAAKMARALFVGAEIQLASRVHQVEYDQDDV
jgi:uncharacterized protein YegP (UPF0339 family)